MDKNLTPLGKSNLFSGKNQPTDVRVCAGTGDSFFCAFETTSFQKGIPNYLNLARYDFTESLPTLAFSKTEVASAMPVVIPDGLPRPGEDLVDDPTPFVYRDRFYVITRKWESAILKVRVFSADLGHLETRELDLSKAFPGLYLSVNSLVNIEGKPYLISGLYNGPPIDCRFFSYIAIIGLDETMTKAGNPIVLSRTKRYEGYVACARYSEGILFVGYDSREYDSPKPGPSSHIGMIKAFDPGNEFKELGSIRINSGRMIDNHFTFEVFDGNLYVFYQSPNEELRVKVISFENSKPNKALKKTR
ncbi:MAG: hypothetical protein JW837_10595 [Sedimentisphaerales bacterium]|nr:hypothetical protein [Sedimentisphaerales bacterium]